MAQPEQIMWLTLRVWILVAILLGGVLSGIVGLSLEVRGLVYCLVTPSELAVESGLHADGFLQILSIYSGIRFILGLIAFPQKSLVVMWNK